MKTNLTRADLDRMYPPEELKKVVSGMMAEAVQLMGPEAAARVEKRFMAEAKDRLADILDLPPEQRPVYSNEVTLQDRIAAAAEVKNCGLFNIVQKDGSEHGYFVINEKRDWVHAVKHSNEKPKPVNATDVVEALAKARHEGCKVKFLN